MKIGFASDHAGFEYKDKLIALMKKKGFETVDFGTYSSESCDYPDFAHRLGNAMDNKEVDLGIALCGSANGITMTGGGSLIWGFDKLIASKTGIPTRVADEAVSCVAYGTGNCLENLSKMQDGTMNLSRQRQMKAR